MKANSASRVPLTGSTLRAGSIQPLGTSKRRSHHAAMASRSSGIPSVVGYTAIFSRLLARASATKLGERCFGSPMDSAIGRLSGLGVTLPSRARSFSNG
ncbi:hypothetical protein D3C86_2009710 [compost metagenome]